MHSQQDVTQIQLNAVERWVEKNLVRYREYKMIGEGISTHWYEDPDGFVLWLKSKYGASPVTYRQYRRRFADYAEKQGFVDASKVIRESSVLVGKGKGKSKTEKSEGKLSKAKASGAKKARQEKLERIRISGSHGYEASLLGLEEIMQFLITARGKFENGKPRYKEGDLIAKLVKLGAMTGLRPVEWYGSYLVSEVRTHLRDEPYKDVLVVKGAVKGQRHNRQGDYRYLSVEHWTPAEKEQLGEMLMVMEKMRDDAEAYLVSIGESNFLKSTAEDVKGVVNKGRGGDVEVTGIGKGASHISDLDGESAGDGDDGARSGGIDLFELGRTIWSKTLRQLSDGTGAIGMRAFNRRGLVTLYTGRHLYASEFRRAKLGDKIDLAEALGHSDIVNQTYYSDSLDLDEHRVMNWSLAKPLRIERAPIEDRAINRRLKGKVNLYRYMLANGRAANNDVVTLLDSVSDELLLELADNEAKMGVKDGAASRLVVERGIGGSRLGRNGDGFGFDDVPVVSMDMDM